MWAIARTKNTIQRAAIVSAFVALLTCILGGCPEFPRPVTPPTTDVNTDSESGRIVAPGATIVSEGNAYDGAVGLPSTGLVGVVKNGQTFLYHPALGDADLTDETSRRAVGQFILDYYGRDSASAASTAKEVMRALPVGDSMTLATGVRLERVSATKYKFTNPKKRWVAVKLGNAEPQWLAPRDTVFDGNLIRLGTVIAGGFRVYTTEEIDVGSDEIETFGAMTLALPFFRVPLIGPPLEAKWAAAIEKDATLFLDVNALEFTELIGQAIRELVGAVTPECFDAAAPGIVAVFEAGVPGAMARDPEYVRQGVVDMGLDVVQDVALCACEAAGAAAAAAGAPAAGGGAVPGASVAATCEAVATVLDIIGTCSWIIDDVALRGWDIVRNDAYAAIPNTQETIANQAPVAENLSVTVAHNTPREIALSVDDPDAGPNTLTYGIMSQPAHGALTGTAPSVVYTPSVGYSGSDSFTFRAYDGQDWSNVATVTITVQTATTVAATIDVTSVSPNPVVVGNQITISYTVRNTGNTARTFGIGREIWQGSTLKADLGAQTTPTIQPNATWNSSVTYTIPTNWSAGGLLPKI